ncbi:MAG: flagellar biosynthesis anti-sigma factor FlgM [Oscillospiraceae bacterium]|nr:flagellar biosynthesis anti-sigma factor FlgM [Oscillospiraceae bacterium]
MSGMKINGPGNIPYAVSGYRVDNKAAGYRKNEAVSGPDELALSEAAVSFSKILAEVKEAVAGQKADNFARITELKAKIEAGTYSISAEDVAEGILGELYG